MEKGQNIENFTPTTTLVALDNFVYVLTAISEWIKETFDISIPEHIYFIHPQFRYVGFLYRLNQSPDGKQFRFISAYFGRNYDSMDEAIYDLLANKFAAVIGYLDKSTDTCQYFTEVDDDTMKNFYTALAKFRRSQFDIMAEDTGLKATVSNATLADLPQNFNWLWPRQAPQIGSAGFPISG